MVFKKLKGILWRILVRVFGFIPFFCQRLMCQLLFEGIAKRDPNSGIRRLISLHDDLAEYLDQTAIRYEKGIHPKHRLTDYHQFFVERLEQGDSVLDIGCGYGAVAFSMAKAGALVTGIDIDGNNIHEAKKRYRHENLKFLLGDITEDILNDHFDVVVMSNVLEHIEDRIALLKMIQNKIHPKRYLIRVPMINRHWLVPLKKELEMPYFSDPTHYTEYTIESFRAEMASAGLSIRHKEIKWGEIWAEVY
jgi:2-polyprenyl-3-methyl-5-hydroxy-6-metoxy-1,4-benzoquinol methylase